MLPLKELVRVNFLLYTSHGNERFFGDGKCTAFSFMIYRNF